ncbi:MAG: TonB-dependent receptor [Spirosomataceae bacterium]
MKKVILAAMLCLSMMGELFAQIPVKGKITGRVVDQNSKIVEFSTIALLKAKDSTLVKGQLTDVNGQFAFDNVTEGNYMVSVSQLGYQKFFSPKFTINAENQAIDLKNIQLKEATQQLQEVAIKASKPFVEQQIDKTVVNVENSIVAAGNSALEVLERSPGVTVDKDGNISLKGKAEVRVMIDGKPTYLSNQDLANMLRNMQASQLATIELITNPSAKFDASGNAGIINIKMKRNQNMGLNGSASLGAGYGRYEKVNGSLNLNYRDGKWNLFGNYSGNYRKSFQTLELKRNFRNGDEITNYFYQTSDAQRKNYGNNIKIGADYFLNKKTTLGILATGSAGMWREYGLNSTNIYIGTSTLDKVNETYRNTPEYWQNLATNLNMKHTFDSTGREITFDADYAYFGKNSNQTYDIRVINGAGTIVGTPYTELGNYETGINIYSAKADYTHPLSKTSKFETGWKSSWVISDNDMKFYHKEGEVVTPILGRTNRFKYNENVNAVYVNYQTKIGKTSVQAGLRMEHWHALGNQVTTGQTFKRDSVQFFPSVFLQRPFSKKYTMGFSYSRRIDRPNYQDLNPFLNFLDPYTYNQGNPYLRPQITNSFEWTHSLMGFINVTLNYSKTRDLMSDVLKQNDAELKTYQTKDNYGFRENYGVALSAPIPVAKWWMSNIYVNVFRNHYNGMLLGAQFDGSITSMQSNLQNTFRLPKDWSFELSGFYTSGFMEGMLIGKPMGQIAVGVQKQLMNKKATLRLNVRDIFWMQQFRGTVQYQNLDVTIHNRWESRVANVAFSYRFGNTKVQASRQRQTGLESEKNRAGGNN